MACIPTEHESLTQRAQGPSSASQPDGTLGIMGTTFDIIPMGPRELPEAAIARIYEGGMSIRWAESEDGWGASATTIMETEGTPWRPAEDWRDPIVERLAALHDWRRDDSESVICFWDPDVLWQVELGLEDVTLRLRRGVDYDSSEPSDAELLRVFSSLPAVVHQPDNGWWMLLDEIDDEFRLLGR